jgi:acyl-CoA thioesterase
MTGETLQQGREDEIRKKLKSIPYVQFLGIKLEEIATGTATLSLELADRLKRNNGIAHGGAIASLIDTATAFATLSVLKPDQHSTTVDLTIHFLRPLRSGKATAKAEVVRAGRRIAVVSATVIDDGGNLAATAVSTYIID